MKHSLLLLAWRNWVWSTTGRLFRGLSVRSRLGRGGSVSRGKTSWRQGGWEGGSWRWSVGSAVAIRLKCAWRGWWTSTWESRRRRLLWIWRSWGSSFRSEIAGGWGRLVLVTLYSWFVKEWCWIWRWPIESKRNHLIKVGWRSEERRDDTETPWGGAEEERARIDRLRGKRNEEMERVWKGRRISKQEENPRFTFQVERGKR